MPSITLETPTSAIDRTSVASQEEYLDIPLSFPFPLERKSGRVNYDQIRQHLISNRTLYYRGILISQNFFFRIYKPNYFSRNNPSSRLSCLIIPVEGGKYNSSQRFSFLFPTRSRNKWNWIFQLCELRKLLELSLVSNLSNKREIELKMKYRFHREQWKNISLGREREREREEASYKTRKRTIPPPLFQSFQTICSVFSRSFLPTR